MEPASTASPAWEPVPTSLRYVTLDLLRGFSLYGVLMVNLWYFFRRSLFQHMLEFHSHPGWWNQAVDLSVAWAFEFKAFDLFSLTFGIGVAVQAERAGQRGVSAARFLARRFLILLVFGLCHMLLISNVDILTLYALCGLVLIPLVRLPRVVLVFAGLAAVSLPSLIPGIHLPGEAVVRAHAAQADRVYGSGSFGEILAFRWNETVTMIAPLVLGTAQRTLGMMLIGIAVWRSGLVQQPRRHRRSLLWFCLAAGIGGVVGTAAFGPDFPGAHVPLALAYGAALLAWSPTVSKGTPLAAVAAAGRMAFTNYLMQSIVLGFVFYGYGLGMFGRLNPVEGAALGTCFYATQLWTSVWWLDRFRFGPFEWVWRSLSYGRRQPMKL